MGTFLGSVLLISPTFVYASDPACNHSVEHILTALRSRAIAVDFQQDFTTSLGPNTSPASRASWNTLQALHTWGVLQQVPVSALRAGVALIPRGSSLALLVRDVTETADGSTQVLLSVIPTSEVKPQPDLTWRINRWILRPASRALRAIRRFFSKPDVFLVSLPRTVSGTTPFRGAPQTSQSTRPYVIHPVTLNYSEKILAGHTDEVYSAAFSPDGSRVITASRDHTARIWNTHSGDLITTLTGHMDRIDSAVFSPDGSRVITTSHNQTARIWDVHSGALITTLTGHRKFIDAAAFSPDGLRVATGSHDHTARIWDAHSGALITTLIGHTREVYSVTFSPDGSRIITASNDHTARIWDAHSGALITTLTGHRSWVSSVAFYPDGSRVVTGSFDQTAKIWNAHSGALITTLTGHTDGVLSVAFSPDGSRVVTGSFDHTAKIWDAYSGSLIATLTGHTNEVCSAVFFEDSLRVGTVSGDDTARIWAVPPYIPWDQE